MDECGLEGLNINIDASIRIDSCDLRMSVDRILQIKNESRIIGRSIFGWNEESMKS
jgi:hypothetical protein